ncbi:hypothetical protein [Campylobacter canadensis]|uniref:CopG family transcriptional regulator n=1 Tax=Campylobacter canadensis TaxID=449520 RepID=A0ABS7WVH6_9BACT|nr:hypothetical protein [Campylobacter canadensis]MBZ7987965.1 hypothetical protein [Campylobacter canadensis]MBZ7995412.1 hypothetical protein [Campylobacter canadensis]MBZ7997040.1 hypothetical protein [Campylobacter canadensis]MBZ7998915.1 hypothetical protein [Campylobacter canadensis]MBZ8000591.1 hypothetical protein [Campylobacter canadensis]
MGFKKLNENDFVNAARGETSSIDINTKRKKSILIHLTEEEVAELTQEAARFRMSRSAYIRFKLFVKEK